MTDKQIITKSQMIMRIAELSANLEVKEQECERLKEEIKNKLVIYKEIKEKSAVFTSEFSLACGAITALEWVLNLEVKNEH